VNAAAATTVTVSNATGGATVTAGLAPTAATTLTVNNVDASGATITAGTFAATTTTGSIVVEGTTGTDDAATISAAGVVSLDIDGAAGQDVENITLSGNGAAATYTIEAGNAYETITVTGDQLVNIKTDADDLTAETVTGANVVTVNGAASAAVDFSSVSAASIDLDVDVDDAITVATGANIEINADQNASTATTEIIAKTDNATLNITAGDDTVGSTASTILLGALDLDNTYDFATVTIDATTAALTATSVVADDAAITITGTKNVTLGNTTAASVDASQSTGVINMTQYATNASVTTGSGNDDITMDENGVGTTVMSLNAGDGNNTVTITDVVNGSTVVTGSGNDTINLDDTTSVVVQGGGGTDSYVVSAVADAVIADSSGTDTMTLDTNAAYDFSAKSNFAFSGIETINISSVTALVTMDAADLSGKTLTITGDGATDILKASGDDGGTATAETIDLSGLTISGTATIQIDGGDKADTLIGSNSGTTFLLDAGDVDAGEVITGGTGTDVIDLTGAVTDLTTATITSVETLDTNGVSTQISQGTGITTVDGLRDGTADTFIIAKYTTSFEASGEGSAGAVDIAGEWFISADTGAADTALTYYDEVIGEAVTIDIDGSVGGTTADTAAGVAGALVLTIA